MGKTVHAEGKIIKGDFQGCYLWKWDDENYYIVGDAYTANGSLLKASPKYEVKVGFSFFWTQQAFQLFLDSNKQCVLNSEVIDKFVDVSSSNHGPDPSVVSKATFYGGAAFGIAAGMTSNSSSATLAVYLKDGKKMLIEFYSIARAQKFKQDMFVF